MPRKPTTKKKTTSYNYRVCCNADLMFTVRSRRKLSVKKLREKAQQELSSIARDPAGICLADAGYDIALLDEGRVYPRVVHIGEECNEGELLEGFSIQDVEIV